ncbi:MAG: hypothetical protein OSB12_08690 [Planctomycetota bacterium]|nr:hypothetical protein [Planctomycetota bacterium]
MHARRNAPIRLHDLTTDPATDPAQQQDLAEEHPGVVVIWSNG